MSADGELYISEVCRDVFEEELSEVFGKGKWRFEVSGFSDFWNMSDFPSMVEVNVLDTETDEHIGIAKIHSKPYIREDNFGGRYIEVEPEKIEIEVVKNGENNGN